MPAAELRGFMNVDSPGLGAALVERGEVGERHVDLAAHLDAAAARPSIRSGIDGDRAQVVRDVLADLAVAARRAALEHAVAVEQRDREAVDLRLADVAELRVLDALAREVVAHPLHPRAQLLLAARVGEREHRLGVADLLERGDRLAADALRRRVGREQLGVLAPRARAARRAARRSRRRRSPGRRGRSSGARGGGAARAARRRARPGRFVAGFALTAARGRPARAAASGRAPRARRGLSTSVRSKWTGVTAIRPPATAARSVPGSSWKPGSAP